MNQHVFERSIKPRLLGFVGLVLIGCGGSSARSDAVSRSGPVQPSPSPFGETQCERYGIVELPRRYAVQNNVFDDAVATQTQCVTAYWDALSETAGFSVDPVSLDTGSNLPGSYPSIVHGWQWGTFFGNYEQARKISAVAAVPTTWSFTTPEAGRYAVAYDIWLHPTPHPPNGDGTLEILIWIKTRDRTPVGAQLTTIEIDGASWDVWYGPNGSFNTLTYVRDGDISDAQLDLRPFVGDALGHADATAEWYLLGVQAGFEIAQATGTLTTTSYRVEIR